MSSRRIENFTEREGVVGYSNLIVCNMILLRRWKGYYIVGQTGLGLTCCTYLSGLSLRTALRGEF